MISDIHSDQNDYRFMKEKSTEIIASSVNFESSSEDFTLYSKYQCYKNFR